MQEKVIHFAINKPKAVVRLMILTAMIVLLGALLPSFFPNTFSAFHTIRVDTDPENMLPKDEPVRVFHDQMKELMNLHELIGVGIVNTTHEDGVYNVETLRKIYELAEFAKTLTWENEEGEQEGVIEVDIMAPSTTDNIEQESVGVVRFDWLMQTPPQNMEEVEALKKKVSRLTYIQGMMFSEDEKALAMTLPISSKDVSYHIYTKLREKIESLQGNGDAFHVAGLPVAEDVFGVEMFLQMAIAAPAAMLVIFLLMLAFFKRVVLVISPLIVALVSVIISMGLLVFTGNTIHIMSSMIPIFIMPIAVLDAVHILSDFFEVYQSKKDRREALVYVMNHLFTPMLYTSITTVIGFGALVLTPIPPVQVFGIFVAIGVAMAWLWTILFIPAYIMLLPGKTLENFGQKPASGDHRGWLDVFLSSVRKISFNHAKAVVASALVLIAISVWGIQQIVVNDNPTRWFEEDHPIRLADTEMNKHLAGTYDTYFALSPTNEQIDKDQVQQELIRSYPALDKSVFDVDPSLNGMDWLLNVESSLDDLLFESGDDVYDEALNTISDLKSDAAIFKNPEALKYLEQLQTQLSGLDVVGKTLSVMDLQKIVNREIYSGEDQHYVIPENKRVAGQHYVTFQGGHRPNDLWHFTTPTYDVANVWVLLNSGNNIDMEQVRSVTEQFMKDNPAPFGLEGKWYGLTYINLIWQDKMVFGMLNAFLSSFAIVLVIMFFLFRSFWWGLLSMLPLSLTIITIYGIIGIAGKEYDIPIAVLSSLSLGLAVDYAIHFLARSREIRKNQVSWEAASKIVFEEPAKAIVRNVFVVGFGFIPLLFSPLVPYQTVGFFIAAILISAGLVTILLLPALIKLLEKRLFKDVKN
ncbi:MMPL family transporter [Phaeodactylibacter sp.]|uniref:efflux RND transporter permease subunit n=1 Tax=Phaeodactylibacter sp. TaxID=1940289 RepID=UPI0025FFD2EC|nr:MMPL family transporter [Phaeodactylibacter sp.]MCI4650803.1 MMPL family transporter [Phaeodactylibacter sp.]MCI5089760.1 MMPL family transporter [Phaeodactylibacter sp.]